MNRVSRVDDRVEIRRVLVSVSDKRGLDVLVEGLAGIAGVRIYSTGGTFSAISQILGDRTPAILSQVSDYTGQPEMQGGLVKTLDYKIYLGLLSEPYNRDHERDRARVGAELIDMVVANLYPFADVTARSDADAEDARGNIDIGGPTMVRAAAKSYLRVAAVCDPADYRSVIDELSANGGTLGLETRFSLAKKAFAHTAGYDRAIAEHLGRMDNGEMIRPYLVE